MITAQKIMTVKTTATGASGGGIHADIINSGETFNPIAAPIGVYILKKGSIILNAPATGILDMYADVRVEVFEPGIVINLVCLCHFNEPSGYMHYGEWEYMPHGNLWSLIGPSGAQTPAATQQYTILEYT